MPIIAGRQWPLATMRSTDTLQASLQACTRTATARQDALRKIDLAARSYSTLDAIRNAVDRVLADLRIEEAEAMRVYQQRHAQIETTTYPDEDPE